MVHHKKTLLLLVCFSMAFSAFQAKAEDPLLMRKFMAAKLAYVDLEGLARYYKDVPQATEPIAELKIRYTNMCIAGRLLGILELAYSALYKLDEPQHVEDRFNDLLDFLEGKEEGSGYVQLLKILARAKRHDGIRDYSFFVRLLLRFAHAVGLTAERPLDALKAACERVAENRFFVENRTDMLQLVRNAFNEAEGGDSLGRIQQAINALQQRFETDTELLFTGIHTHLHTLIGIRLPQTQRNNRSAREGRERVYYHVGRFQEVFRDPNTPNRDSTLNLNNRQQGSLRAGFGVGASGVASRL